MGVTTLRPVDVVCSGRAVNTYRPCGTPGENGELDMPFVKMTGKCAGGLAMQLKGETGINMYCMLMPHAEAVDSSC